MFNNWKFDNDVGINDLVEVGDQLITKKGCKIYIPTSYEDRGLLIQGDTITTLGFFLYLVGDTYSVAMAHAKMELSPLVTNKVKIGEVRYFELIFEPGAVVITNTTVVKDDTMPYYVHKEFISNGRMPEFVSYDLALRLFEESPYFSGYRVGANVAIPELLITMVARTDTDLMAYFRNQLVQPNDMYEKKPTFIPFSSVILNTTNTMSKLGGNYFENAVIASLVTETTRVEPIEEMIRR